MATSPGHGAPSPTPRPGLWALIRSGYRRSSLVALLVLVLLYTSVGVQWHHLIDWSLGMDWLLVGIWLFMSALLSWDVRAERDVPLAVVAFFGGLVIEGWGTTSLLWSYFTAERPPLWILPAWPVAALTVDRLARMLDALVPRVDLRWIWWGAVPAFVVAMSAFSWAAISVPTTPVVIALMVGVAATRGGRLPHRWHHAPTDALRAEVLLFLAGTMLGIFLEYWGTSRRCWTYHTGQVPPPVAVVAHGFASIAFLRGVQLLRAALGRLGASVPWATP